MVVKRKGGAGRGRSVLTHFCTFEDGNLTIAELCDSLAAPELDLRHRRHAGRPRPSTPLYSAIELTSKQLRQPQPAPRHHEHRASSRHSCEPHYSLRTFHPLLTLRDCLIEPAFPCQPQHIRHRRIHRPIPAPLPNDARMHNPVKHCRARTPHKNGSFRCIWRSFNLLLFAPLALRRIRNPGPTLPQSSLELQDQPQTPQSHSHDGGEMVCI